MSEIVFSIQAKGGWLLLLMLLGVLIVGLPTNLNISRVNRSGLKIASHLVSCGKISSKEKK